MEGKGGGKTVSEGKGKSKCKVPEAGKSRESSKNCHEAHVAEMRGGVTTGGGSCR